MDKVRAHSVTPHQTKAPFTALREVLIKPAGYGSKPGFMGGLQPGRAFGNCAASSKTMLATPTDHMAGMQLQGLAMSCP